MRDGGPDEQSKNAPRHDIAFDISPDPRVTIVIPTYGQVATTLACLESLARFPPSCPYDVIVVDDAFPDEDAVAALKSVAGIRLIRNAVNLGFLKTCNLAGRAAKGEYLYLLNNDTELRPGSIDELVALLDARLDVGAAGSKLLFSDGVLQEAGGIVWRDASAWNFGRGADPGRPEFEYLREADYCSGASLLVRSSLWNELHGFDEAFAPAYYEDVDLAFRIRDHGLRLMYEPRSVVIHHEGVSHGHDLKTGAKAQQPINQRTMKAHWAERLRFHYPNGQHVLRARDRAWGKRVVLVVDHFPPEYDRDAGSRSTLGIIRSLVEADWVVKFWPLNRLYHPRYTVNLERLGIEVIDQRSPLSLDAWMRENGEDLDHILVVRPDAAEASLAQFATGTDAVLSYYGVDLHFARLNREAVLKGDRALANDAIEMEVRERRIWRRFDLVLYPSEEEAAVVRSLNPSVMARAIVPFQFEVSSAAAKAPASPSILFVAGFAHPPNVDAAEYLIREIVPLIEGAMGPVHVTLAGSNPSEKVRSLASSRVAVTGYVSDPELERLYRTHRVSCVPLRFGAGVKGKVVEALSHGLPLVTTSVGAQGIAGLSDVAVVEDDAWEIAAKLTQLISDDAAWIEQARRQTAFAERHFSRRRMQESVLEAFLEAERAAPDRLLPWQRTPQHSLDADS